MPISEDDLPSNWTELEGEEFFRALDLWTRLPGPPLLDMATFELEDMDPTPTPTPSSPGGADPSSSANT